MEIGIEAPHCDCTAYCQKGVEPMGDCICRLPGKTVVAHCEIEGGSTWHNNGSCISCVRKAREAKKEANALRHAEIMASPPSGNDYTQIEEAEVVPEPSGGSILVSVTKGPSPANSALLEVVIKINGVELSITKDPARIQRILQCS